MNSSELRSIIGNLKKNHLNGMITDQEFLQSLQNLDLDNAFDDDENLNNLKNVVARHISRIPV
jgi:hypothetical protein